MNSIKGKLTLMFCLIAIIPIAILGVVAYNSSDQAMMRMVEERVQSNTAALNGAITNTSARAQAIAEWYAQDPVVIAAYQSGKKESFATLSPIYKTLNKTDHIAVFEFGDLKGTVLYRLHNPEKSGDSKLESPFVSGALAGSSLSGIEFGSSGMAIRGIAPIKVNGAVVGTLQVGINDGVLDLLTNASQSDVTIFEGQKVSASSLTLDDAKKQAIEATLQQALADFDKGETHFMAIDENHAAEFFSPLMDPTGKTRIGAVSVLANNVAVDQFSKNFTKLVISLVAGFGALCAVIAFFIANRFAQPIQTVTTCLESIQAGDLTTDTNSLEPITRQNDEIGRLAHAAIQMQKSLKDLVEDVLNSSAQLEMGVQDIGKNIIKINAEIEEITATTEEISANMQETASSTEEMNAIASEIEDASTSIAHKAESGASDANAINSRAESLKKNAVHSKKTATELYDSARIRLEDAIEKSKSVNDIRAFSEAILQIAEQTNLLALNASIEAARAGETGRGFAVVADEIRKLAENSKEAVEEIQKMTVVVVQSVGQLSTSSNEMLSFINNRVINDYQMLVETGEQYSNDAATVNDMVSDFSATSEELTASIQTVVRSLTEVSGAISETAKGTENIGTRSLGLSGSSAGIVKQLEELKEQSHHLNESIGYFKI